MTCSATLAADSPVFDENLRALETCAANVARRLSDMPIPSHVAPALARDDSPTFRIGDNGHDPRWLGHTSMPSVRAAALVETFGPDGSNVLMPSIGAGTELKLLLDGTASYSAVFVLADDWLDVRLALALTDFSKPIRDGRLIILDNADPSQALIDFFEQSPGYEFPQRMLVLPHIDVRAIEPLRAVIEQASMRITQFQTERIAAYSATLAQRASRNGSPRRISILSLDPRPTVALAANALHEAAGRCGLDAGVCIPDRPVRCHALARMQAMVEHDSGTALLLNSGWGHLLNHVPDSMPTATWLLPDAQILAGKTDGFSAGHVVFAATPTLARAAINAGVDADRVHLLEVAGDDGNYHPLDDHDRALFDVACIGDVQDLEPAASGIELTSHVRLWEYLCAEAAEHIEAAPDKIFAEAQRRSGVEVTEEHVRAKMLAFLQERVIPTSTLQAVVQSLLDGGIDVRVFGAGWQHTRIPTSRVNPAPATPQECNKVYNEARIVLLPVFRPDTAQRCLNVTIAGGCVVYRKPPASLAELHPRLAEVLSRLPMLDNPRTARKQIRSYLRDDDKRQIVHVEAKKMIFDRHLWTHRLTTISAALASPAITP